MKPDPIWVFARGDEQLTVHRTQTDTGFLLVLDDGTAPRSYSFKDELSLIAFQSDMETVLMQTGWSLVTFEPDQRTGLDRRSWPRLATDRRRWWTDGVPRKRRGLFKDVAWLSDKMNSKTRE
jgi:hypothetical protein